MAVSLIFHHRHRVDKLVGDTSMIRKSIGLALILSATATSAFATNVPEIDPGSMVGAMALLSTGLVMIMDRRRSK